MLSGACPPHSYGGNVTAVPRIRRRMKLMFLQVTGSQIWGETEAGVRPKQTWKRAGNTQQRPLGGIFNCHQQKKKLAQGLTV